MANRITLEQIERINILYLRYHTYAGVAREMGIAPTTVKKYVVKDFQPVDDREIKRFEGELPSTPIDLFRCDNWGDICVLSNNEKAELDNLREEIMI